MARELVFPTVLSESDHKSAKEMAIKKSTAISPPLGTCRKAACYWGDWDRNGALQTQPVWPGTQGKVLGLGWELNKSPPFLVFLCSKPQIRTAQHVYRQLRIQKTIFLKNEWVLAEKLGRLPNLCHSPLLFVSKKYPSFNHESNTSLKMLPWITQWSDKSEPYKKNAANPCHQHKSYGFSGRTQCNFL